MPLSPIYPQEESEEGSEEEQEELDEEAHAEEAYTLHPMLRAL